MASSSFGDGDGRHSGDGRHRSNETPAGNGPPRIVFEALWNEDQTKGEPSPGQLDPAWFVAWGSVPPYRACFARDLGKAVGDALIESEEELRLPVVEASEDTQEWGWEDDISPT